MWENGSQRKILSYEHCNFTNRHHSVQKHFPEENTIKTRQQSQQVQEGSFCYLLSCTNTALIFLSQLRAFEHFTFVFLVALQNFKLQACTDRISVPPPAGKISTERCMKRSFHPLITTSPVTHRLILCWSHLVLIERLVGAAIKVGQMTNKQCLSAEKSRVLSRKKEHVLSRLVWKAVLPLGKISSLLCSQEKKNQFQEVQRFPQLTLEIFGRTQESWLGLR